MTLDPMHDPAPSRDALALYRVLRRTGGSMRVATLLRRLTGDDRAALCAAIDELCEHYWIRITWRKRTTEPPPGELRPIDDIDRLCTTRFGRRKYAAATWAR